MDLHLSQCFGVAGGPSPVFACMLLLQVNLDLSQCLFVASGPGPISVCLCCKSTWTCLCVLMLQVDRDLLRCVAVAGGPVLVSACMLLCQVNLDLPQCSTVACKLWTSLSELLLVMMLLLQWTWTYLSVLLLQATLACISV